MTLYSYHGFLRDYSRYATYGPQGYIDLRSMIGGIHSCELFQKYADSGAFSSCKLNLGDLLQLEPFAGEMRSDADYDSVVLSLLTLRLAKYEQYNHYLQEIVLGGLIEKYREEFRGALELINPLKKRATASEPREIIGAASAASSLILCSRRAFYGNRQEEIVGDFCWDVNAMLVKDILDAISSIFNNQEAFALVRGSVILRTGIRENIALLNALGGIIVGIKDSDPNQTRKSDDDGVLEGSRACLRSLFRNWEKIHVRLEIGGRETGLLLHYDMGGMPGSKPPFGNFTAVAVSLCQEPMSRTITYSHVTVDGQETLSKGPSRGDVLVTSLPLGAAVGEVAYPNGFKALHSAPDLVCREKRVFLQIIGETQY